MQTIQFVDLHTQYQKIKPEVDAAIEKVINDSAFIGGKYVNEFEIALKTYLEAGHVIPCGNGTDALQLALMALDLKHGDEVIVPGFCFVAPAEAVALLNLTPVFADVDFDTFNISAETIAPLITEKTKAIIVVHLFGQPANMKDIIGLAKKHDLKIIEDVAQALGAKVNVNEAYLYAGLAGDLGCTSFFPSKNLACFGDGGAVFSNDDELAKKVRMMANHGQQKKYTHELIGVNSRLDGIQAAILTVKLKQLGIYLLTRRRVAAFYNERLDKVHWLQIPLESGHEAHSYNQYTIILDPSIDRVHLVAYLQEKGIPTMVYYPGTLPEQQAYQIFSKESLQNSKELSKRVLSLPMHTELEPDQQQFICNALINYKL